MLQLLKPSDLPVRVLKNVLLKYNLKTTGTKTELLSRLAELNSNDDWVKQINMDNVTSLRDEEDNDEVIVIADGTSQVGENKETHDVENLIKQLELARIETELGNREIALLKRENEFLRKMHDTPSYPERSSVTSMQPSLQEQPRWINALKVWDLLPDFDGAADTYENWEKQIKFLQTAYKLDENFTRVLIASKLKGKAQRWFQSQPEYINMNLNDLFVELRGMFHFNTDDVTRLRQFEARLWKSGETFSDYVHEKIIMANKVHIDKEEIIEYLIEGIPIARMRDNARMQKFQSKEEFLKSFDKIFLNTDLKVQLPKQESKDLEKDDKKTDGNLRCYNCKKDGHVAKDCLQRGRQKGSCFRCHHMGHISKDCPTRKEDMKPDEGYWPIIACKFSGTNADCCIILETLLDTGSPISFVRKCFVPTVVTYDPPRSVDLFYGINETKLQVLGSLKAALIHDTTIASDVELFVVPDKTMSSAIVLGRDVLHKLGMRLTKQIPTVNKAVAKILNVG